MTSLKLSLDNEDPNLFLTGLHDDYPTRTDITRKKTKLHLKTQSTSLPVPQDENGVNDLLAKIRGETRKIALDSPRTQEAMKNLGVKREECLVQEYEKFSTTIKSTKMQKMLYVYYIGHVNDTIVKVLEERDKVRQNKRTKVLSLDTAPLSDRGPIHLASPVGSALEPRPNFISMGYEAKLERLKKRNESEIQMVERQTMLFLESERHYRQKLELMSAKQEKIIENRKLSEKQRLKELSAKKKRYMDILDKAKRMAGSNEDEEEDDYYKSQTGPLSARDFKELHDKDYARIKEHRMREMIRLEQQKIIEERLLEREQDSLIRSSVAMEELKNKELKSKIVLEKLNDQKKSSLAERNDKYEQVRNRAQQSTSQSPEPIVKYVEKMKKAGEQLEKNEAQRKKDLQKKKKQWKDHLLNMEERMGDKERDLEYKDSLREERAQTEAERLMEFELKRKQSRDQKIDANNFRAQRSQIHLNNIQADMVRKSNLIMNKNRTWKDGSIKKHEENEALRAVSMKNRFLVHSEKDSLISQLDQISKLQSPSESSTGKIFKTQSTFNIKNFSDFVSDNLMKSPRKLGDKNHTPSHSIAINSARASIKS